MAPVRIDSFFEDPNATFNWFHGAITGLNVLNFAAVSGLASKVAQGPTGMADLAELIAVPHDHLARAVRYLQAHGLVEVSDDLVVSPNAHTARIVERAGLWGSLFTTAAAGSQLYEGLRQGKTPFEVRFGAPVFEFFAEHPELAGLFGQFMSFMTDRVTAFVSANHRFEPFEVVADIGGSFAGLLLSVLQDYPGTKGILFELPSMAEQARPVIGASQLADRVDVVGGSFFEEVPAADLYLLKQILHDWSDEECVHILSTIRRAIRPGGRVAIMDHLLAEEPTVSEGLATDISMMIWDTGRERMRHEFEDLFAASGFRLDRITENPHGHSVIEAIPV